MPQLGLLPPSTLLDGPEWSLSDSCLLPVLLPPPCGAQRLGLHCLRTRFAVLGPTAASAAEADAATR